MFHGQNNLVFILCLFLFSYPCGSSSLLKTKHIQSASSSFLQIKQKNDTPSFTFDTNANGIFTHYAYGECTNINCLDCIDKNICQCPTGFAQDPKVDVSSDVKSCQYKLNHQGWFFLLELVFWFGIGHFYAGRFLYGGIKLTSIIFVILFDISVKKCMEKSPYRAKKNFNIFIYILYFFILCWQIFDIVMIGMNKFKDGSGFEFKTFDKR
jgi:hypothetical protein